MGLELAPIPEHEDLEEWKYWACHEPERMSDTTRISTDRVYKTGCRLCAIGMLADVNSPKNSKPGLIQDGNLNTFNISGMKPHEQVEWMMTFEDHKGEGYESWRT